MVGVAACCALLLLAGAEVEDLGWLAGNWVSEGQGRWTEERWAPPRGGVMVGTVVSGTVVSGKGEAASGFEFMRIAPDASGEPVFWASPEGKTPVPFTYAGGGPREARFANKQNDYPNLIVYRRDGRLLKGTISKLDGSQANSWTYKLRK